MNTLTNKQVRELMNEFSPKSDGYVLKLTRAQFEELVEDATDVDISETEGSNGNRLKALLKSSTDEQVEALVKALRAV
jgi:hypothetical protein